MSTEYKSSDYNFDSPIDIADREVGIVAVLKKLRYDLTACQGRVSEALKMIGTLDLPELGERVPCPTCGRKLAGENTLAEHIYNVHDGPEPAHYALTEERSAA